MRFLIAIPTFNRPELLLETVDSIMAQNYHDWRIVISDNQSKIPATKVLGDRMADPRLRVIRQQDHVTGTEHGRRLYSVIKNESYNYVSFTADDDYMVPGALSHIASLPNLSQMVVGNIGYFYQKSGKVVATGQQFFGQTAVLNSRRAMVLDAARAGIATNEPKASPDDLPENHASFIFLHRELMQKLDQAFGGFLVEPFGDIGLGRANAFIDHYTYVTRPIGVVRFFNNYGQGQQDRRKLTAHHRIAFKFSPLKHVSFANCAAESYFTVLSDLGIAPAKPSPTLLLRHLREILLDSPKNGETFRALCQAIGVVIRQGQLGSILAFAVQRRPRQEMHRNTLPGVSTDIDSAAAALLTHYGSRSGFA